MEGYAKNQSYLNQYTAGPAGPISNDSNHEISNYAGLAYGYRNDGKLKSVGGNGNAYGVAYDAFGRCIKRTLNGAATYYTYDGPHPIYEWKADGTRAGWNLYGQRIDEILLRGDFVVLEGGQGYFFQHDRLGSVMILSGFAGESIEAYRYDAFGQFASWSRGSFNSRFKFTGREYHEAFGIYEYRNRAYHPGLGRFLSEDPMGFAAGDSNMFRYCGGDPVNHTDPFGLTPAGKSAEKIYFYEDKNSGTPGVVVSDTYVHDQNTNPFDSTKAFFDGAMDWGPFEQVMQYLGGGDHQGGPSGDPGGGGAGPGRSFDSGVTEVTYGPAGVVVTFIWNPIDTLFWFGPGSPFGGLENSVFGGLVLTGYANNALPSLGGGRSEGGPARSAGSVRSDNFLAEFRKEYAKYNLPQFGNFMAKVFGTYAVIGVGGIAGGEVLMLTPVANITSANVASIALMSNSQAIDFARGFASPGAIPSSPWMAAGQGARYFSKLMGGP
jgi:RHS repeat-associated protein